MSAFDDARIRSLELQLLTAQARIRELEAALDEIDPAARLIGSIQ